MPIDLHDVTIQLGSTLIIKGVDLTVPDGAFLAIVGPNGSGKTTLLRGIYQAVRPTSGAVFIGERDVMNLPAREAARLRTVVPQFQDGEIGLTALEVVATGRHVHAPWWALQRADDALLARHSLARVGAEALSDRLFDTLSGGERQRVLLAQQAATLLLDEPTNHLDAHAQLDLLDLLSDLPLIRVAVLHDLDHALAYSDIIAVIQDGKLVAIGPPETTLTGALTSDAFGLRSQIIEHPLTRRPHLLTASADPMPTTRQAQPPASTGRPPKAR